METVSVIFVNKDKTETKINAPVGISILEVAHQNGIDLEGSCEGSLACATCHVILEQKQYDMLDMPSEEEEDMLDLAFDLTHTSRLGCQIILSSKMDGMKIILPSQNRNSNLSEIG